MRSYNIDSFLEAGSFPELSLLCYSVSLEESKRRKLTRYSEGDILSQYIDVDSIHAEWTYDTDNIFEPGGIIPITLSFRLLPGHGLSKSTILKPTYAPQSAEDYAYIFRPRVKFTRPGYYTDTYPFPFMILKERVVNHGDADSYKLYFEDESCVFDYVNFDLASKFGYTWKQIVRIILNLTRQGGSDNIGITGTANLTGTSYYQGDPMSARQVLSYIAQMNGVFMTRKNDSNLYIRQMLDAEESGDRYVEADEIRADYVFDVYREHDWPEVFTYKTVLVKPYNEISVSHSVNDPYQYFLNTNPFIVQDNVNTYFTLLWERLRKKLQYSGEEIITRFNPNYEIGDYISYIRRKRRGAIVSESGSPISIARIVWNGGAFCTIYGARFGVDNR